MSSSILTHLLHEELPNEDVLLSVIKIEIKICRITMFCVPIFTSFLLLLIIALNSKLRFCKCLLNYLEHLTIVLLSTIISNSNSESSLKIFHVERLLLCLIASMQKFLKASFILFIFWIFECLRLDGKLRFNL